MQAKSPKYDTLHRKIGIECRILLQLNPSSNMFNFMYTFCYKNSVDTIRYVSYILFCIIIILKYIDGGANISQNSS